MRTQLVLKMMIFPFSQAFISLDSSEIAVSPLVKPDKKSKYVTMDFSFRLIQLFDSHLQYLSHFNKFTSKVGSI
jgi:hypothetical protein